MHLRRFSTITAAFLASLAVSLLGAGEASAQLPCIPPFCHPAAPLAPATPPPQTPQTEAALRARFEAEARAKMEAEERQRAARDVHEERRRAWIQRGVQPEPNPLPIRLPMFEIFTPGRISVGFVSDDLGLWSQGVGLGARLRLKKYLGFEVAGSYGVLHLVDERFPGVTLEPSVLLMSQEPSAMDVYVRSGLEVTLPLKDAPQAPDAVLGAHLGGGFQFRAVRIGRRGFMGWFIEARLLFRTDVGGDLRRLPTPHGAIEYLFGPSMGF
ncbi:hypothetical protein [Chondromyces apiculatus]|nr:hypothetical protein [Chondromyces apiculatus]